MTTEGYSGIENAQVQGGLPRRRIGCGLRLRDDRRVGFLSIPCHHILGGRAGGLERDRLAGNAGVRGVEGFANVNERLEKEKRLRLIRSLFLFGRWRIAWRWIGMKENQMHVTRQVRYHFEMRK